MTQPCPFCDLAPDRTADQNALAVSILDGFPVAPGHTLILPRRHIASLFEATASEREALWELVERSKARLEAERNPDGFNLGVNVGRAAGQTVMHLHVHLIPRYQGDMTDPRGGVRHVIPEKGRY